MPRPQVAVRPGCQRLPAQGRGAWLLPTQGDEVVVAFQGGDVRQPVVVGALWSGKAGLSESSQGEWVIDRRESALGRLAGRE